MSHHESRTSADVCAPSLRSSDLWYRYAPSYVSPAYHLLEGFPFIQEPPSGDLQERVLIRHHDYDQKAVPDRKSGSAGMPRPISYAVFCLKKKKDMEKDLDQEPQLLMTLEPDCK